MQRLIDGARKFRSEEFGRYRQLFQSLSISGQKPHTLFITCSDSRVIAELITQSKPGDLFVVKNVGNIVPPAGVTGDTNSTAAAIEFAIDQLQVTDIVVCGHSQCGAMTALMEQHDLSALPHLQAWLNVALTVRETIRQRYAHLPPGEPQITAAAEENVLFALVNLRTYPCVRQRLEQGSLQLHGWFFKIATAELFVYEPELNQFSPIVSI